METIEVVMDKDHIFALAMEAHRQHMTLNDFVLSVVMDRADGIIKKSEQLIGQEELA